MVKAIAGRRQTPLGRRRRPAVDLSLSRRVIRQHGRLQDRNFPAAAADQLEDQLPLDATDCRYVLRLSHRRWAHQPACFHSSLRPTAATVRSGRTCGASIRSTTRQKALPPRSANWRPHGVRLRDQAVLCRSNSRLNDIAVALEAQTYPGPSPRQPLRARRSARSTCPTQPCFDPFGDALVRVASLPRYNVPLQDIHTALDCAARRGRPRVSASPPSIHHPWTFHARPPPGWRGSPTDLETLSAQSRPWDFLTSYLLDRTEIGRLMASAVTVAARMRNVAVWQFLNFLREQSPVQVRRADPTHARARAPARAARPRSATCVRCRRPRCTWMPCVS